jgi:hypothetical protein
MNNELNNSGSFRFIQVHSGAKSIVEVVHLARLHLASAYQR